MIEVRGEEDVHDMLKDYMAPILPKRMQGATKAGASVFKAPLKAEARQVSKRMARAVTVRRAARDRPASIVTFRRKVAFFSPFVIAGTKDHGPVRAKALVFQGRNGLVVTRRVRGVKPNPMVARVADRYSRQAYEAIDRYLDSTEAK